MIENYEVRRGDIVYATAGVVGAHIQKNNRPYLILSNDFCNKYGNVVVGIPFTTAKKNLLPTHYRFFWNRRYNIALCEQPTLICKDDITEFKDVINKKHLAEIEKRVKLQLGLKGE